MAIGSKGINIMEFCKQFNARTQDKPGKVLPAVITYYTDKSFDFVVKTPPVAIQLLEITKLKSGDLNCFELDAAMKMVAGTARSMGITVKGTFPNKNN